MPGNKLTVVCLLEVKLVIMTLLIITYTEWRNTNGETNGRNKLSG